MAYIALKMDDILRDEKSWWKQLNAKMVRGYCAKSLSPQLNLLVKSSSEEIEKLESSTVELNDYVRNISRIGGNIFTSQATGDEDRKILSGLGSSVVAILSLRDMIRDFKNDIKTGAYNPLKYCPFQGAYELLDYYGSRLNMFLGDKAGTMVFGGGQRGGQRGGLCAGWSQMGFCYILCMMFECEGCFTGVPRPAP